MDFWDWAYVVLWCFIILGWIYNLLEKNMKKTKNPKTKRRLQNSCYTVMWIGASMVGIVCLIIAAGLWYYFGGFLFFDGDEPFIKFLGSIFGVLGTLLIISGIITIFKR